MISLNMRKIIHNKIIMTNQMIQSNEKKIINWRLIRKKLYQWLDQYNQIQEERYGKA